MRTLEEIRTILGEHKAALREQFGVRRIGVFGSCARGENTACSDVDVLVEFERPVGWEIVDLHRLLEEILAVKVDLLTEGALRRKPQLRRYVEEDLAYV